MQYYTTSIAQIFVSDTGRAVNIIDDRCAIYALATSSQYGAEETIPVEPASAPQALKPAYAF